MLFLLLVFRVLFLDTFQLSQCYVVFFVIGSTDLVQGKKGVFGVEIGDEIEGCFLDVKDDDQKNDDEGGYENDEICLPAFKQIKA